ncbi:MAG: GNAT family N-acetyltransferase [Schwartzia sp.]|nr:GNAT family N-acetyltransferase [Schwartzia sp. (in: firmicutes)]
MKKMEYHKIGASAIEALWELQKLYKKEIGEDEPDGAGKDRLAEAIRTGSILFFGVFDHENLIGCCSVTVGFSTFNYLPCGTFEDFYILPEYRHRGIARELVRFARLESGVSSLTVGCSDCDLEMYKSLGFSIPIGNLLAFD